MENQFTSEKAISVKRRLLCWVLTLIPFAYLVIVVVRYSVDVPFFDQWNLIHLLEKFYQGTLTFDDLWARGGEHRVLFPRAIMILLAYLTGWNVTYELAVNILLAVGIFLAITCQIRMTLKCIGIHGTYWVIPIISFMVFSLNQVENWLVGWQITYFLNVFAVVSGTILLAHPVFRWWRFLFAVLLGIVASYSFAVGFLYWPIGLLSLFFVFRNNSRIMKLSGVLWVTAGFITIFLHIYDYRTADVHYPTAAGYPLSVIMEQPLEYVQYVLNVLGAPLLTFANRVHEVPIINKLPFCNQAGVLVGFLGLIVSCFTIWLLIRSQSIKFQALVPYFALSLYSVGTALSVGIGRAGLGSAQGLSSRYVTVSNLFWMSNVVFLYFLYVVASSNKFKLTRYARNNVRKYALLSISIIVFLVALSSVHRSISASNRYQYLLAARNELLSVYRDDSYLALRPVFPNAYGVKRRLKILRKYHLSIFRQHEDYTGPSVMNPQAEPKTVFGDGSGSVLITASVFDADGDYCDSCNVVVDIPWQIFRNQEMCDDGTHGDVAPRDSVYSYTVTIPASVSDSPKTLVITATDDAKNTAIGAVSIDVIRRDAIYVDNCFAEFVSDEWVCSTGLSDASGAYGNDFCCHKAGDGSSTATWRPHIRHAGNYNVYAFWTTGYLRRATNAKFTIYYDGGSHTKEVSQTTNGGKWNYLGTYYFAAGTSGHVILSDEANGYVIADAIKLTPNGIGDKETDNK